VDPASATFDTIDLDIVKDTLAVFGIGVKYGRHILDRRGYFAGHDDARAADLNAFFGDDAIQGIFAVRGGWGSARLLPLLDYDSIRRHPKVLLGFSDITALHLAIYARTAW
jgi:muramoyltetrapeptide carboxypeptidase